MSEYVPQSRDTSEKVERFWFDRLRAMEPWRKPAMVARLDRQTQALALAGQRMRYPNPREREAVVESFDILAIQHVVGGSVASAIVGGPPRFTADDGRDNTAVLVTAAARP